MLRILVFVLIAANLLYFGWSHWAAADKPVLTATVAAGKKKADAPLAPPPCATLGPFHDELLAEQAEKQLAGANWRPQRRASSEEVNDGWWVYVPNHDADAQARTLKAIRGAGLRDAFAMPDDPQFPVSVGLFSDEQRAEDRATRIRHLKLEAVVTERRKQQQTVWLDLPGVARETLGDGRLDRTGLPLDVLRIEACPPAAPQEAVPHAPEQNKDEASPAEKAGAAKAAGTGFAATAGTREVRRARV